MRASKHLVPHRRNEVRALRSQERRAAAAEEVGDEMPLAGAVQDQILGDERHLTVG